MGSTGLWPVQVLQDNNPCPGSFRNQAQFKVFFMDRDASFWFWKPGKPRCGTANQTEWVRERGKDGAGKGEVSIVRS